MKTRTPILLLGLLALLPCLPRLAAAPEGAQPGAPVLDPAPRTRPSPVASYDFSKITGANIDESKVARTIHVNAKASSSSGDGSEARPFATVAAGWDAALAALEKGQATRLLLHPGTYREGNFLFDGAKLGRARDTLFVIEAAKPGTVTLSGADELPAGGWREVKAAGQPSYFVAEWPHRLGLFPGNWKQHNPRLASEHRRELLIVDGVPQQQVMLELYEYDGKATEGENDEASGAPREVAKFGRYTYTQTLDPAEALPPGGFGVIERDADPAKRRIAWRPLPGVDPRRARVEAGLRPMLMSFRNKENLVLRGIAFVHSVGRIGQEDGVVIGKNWPQSFAAKNILIEDCRFLQNSGTQLSLGYVESLTLRRSEVSYGAYGGVALWGGQNILWEDNQTNFNNWRMIGGWASAALKAHLTQGFVIRRHTSLGNYSNGLWFDIEVENVLVERAVLAGNLIGLDWEISRHLLVRDSVIVNNVRSALAVLSAGDVVVENSVLAGFAGTGQLTFEAKNRTIEGKYSLRRVLGQPEMTYYLDRLELRDSLVAVSPQPDLGRRSAAQYQGVVEPGFVAPTFVHHIGEPDYYAEFLRKGVLLDRVLWSPGRPDGFGLRALRPDGWQRMGPVNEWVDLAEFNRVTGNTAASASSLVEPGFTNPAHNDFTFRADSPLHGSRLPRWKISDSLARAWEAHQRAPYMKGPRSFVSGFMED